MNFIMKLDNIAKNIRDIISKKRENLGLSFYEETHTYEMLGRTDYPSVTKVIANFYEKFPSEEASLNLANGDVNEQKRILKEWEDAGIYSTNLGSRVHYLLEKRLIELCGNYKEVRLPIFNCDESQIIKSDAMISAGHKYIDLMFERNCVLLDTEMVLGHPELGYTGQPDKVWLVESKNKDSFGIVITDWKSNKKKNFQETVWTKRMYKPFDKYPNTALGHYYIQLPLYGKLLLKMLENTEYSNIKLFGCIIVHLLDDGNYTEYRVPVDIIDTILQMDMKNYLKF